MPSVSAWTMPNMLLASYMIIIITLTDTLKLLQYNNQY